MTMSKPELTGRYTFPPPESMPLHPLLQQTLRDLGWIPASEAVKEVVRTAASRGRSVTTITRDGNIEHTETFRIGAASEPSDDEVGRWSRWVDGLGDPAARAWKRWDGTKPTIYPQCPIPPGITTAIQFRDGERIVTDHPEQMRWGWTRPYKANADIVAFRVL